MKILLINQNFYPDISATGQYLTDLARKLKEDGHEVTVLCSRRSYLNHLELYPKNESYEGIHIERVWTPGLKRDGKIKRILQALCYLLSFFFSYLSTSKHDRVLVLTSPPLLHWSIAAANLFKGATLLHWAMDINPEQAIRTGWLDENGVPARILKSMNAFFLRRYSRIIALDRFMALTIQDSGVDPQNIHVCALWPTISDISLQESDENSFIAEHQLQNKYVIMYSGNHSICHPLDTLLQVAFEMREEPSFAFVFVGGGARFSEVTAFKEKHNLSNIVQIGYQPIEKLSAMLTAATMHVVTMGDLYVGLVHPSKIYNIMRCNTPVLYIGPEESPVIETFKTPLTFRHGQVNEIIKKLITLYEADPNIFNSESITRDGKNKMVSLIEAQA